MEIGFIGLGDMGKQGARILASQGHRVNGCDLPEKKRQLEEELDGTGIHILKDGIEVSRRSDLILYCVEAENIEKAVRQYGPSTKVGAIVGGQTSVKTPEILALEENLPKDAHINTCHSLHGPKVDPKGQTLAAIRHRSSDKSYEKFLDILKQFDSKIVEIPDYKEHDKITADTQVVTHAGFESMGTAWKNVGVYPWEKAPYSSAIDNVKILMCLRIYGGKSHVYSGLAILNPYAREQVKQYAQSVTELFELMIQEKKQEFMDRIEKARDFVFGSNSSPILLDDKIMGEFSLGMPSGQRKPNSHLSLLGMVDAWHKLKINPYDNMICQTPVYRLRLGIVEYLFKNAELYEESLQTALFDKGIRRDDLKFNNAVSEWASIIENGDTAGYKNKFDETKAFFQDRLADGVKQSSALIKRLAGSG